MRSPSPGQRGHWRVAPHRRPGGGRPRRRIRGLEPVAQARAGWAGAVGQVRQEDRRPFWAPRAVCQLGRGGGCSTSLLRVVAQHQVGTAALCKASGFLVDVTLRR